jgi:phage portal protein BeeE
MTGQEAQTVEARNHQIEEVARAFGVPRPFLMMDDTSWGSGIEQLAIMFVRFGLNPGIVAWEQGLRRVLLSTPLSASATASTSTSMSCCAGR